MKSTGEAMAIGRTFEESMLKALRSSEYDPAVDWNELDDDELEADYLVRPTPDRPYAIFEAFARNYTVDEIVDLTDIERWYVERFPDASRRPPRPPRTATSRPRPRPASPTRRSPRWPAASSTTPTPPGSRRRTWPEKSDEPTPKADGAGVTVDDVEAETVHRDFKLVDTCAGEFEATTPYYYSTRDPVSGIDRNELQIDPEMERRRGRRRPHPHRAGASSSTTARSTPSAPWRKRVSTPTSSTTILRPSRRTTTPQTASSSSPSRPRRSPTSSRRPTPTA